MIRSTLVIIAGTYVAFEKRYRNRCRNFFEVKTKRGLFLLFNLILLLNQRYVANLMLQQETWKSLLYRKIESSSALASIFSVRFIIGTESPTLLYSDAQ